jgi:hypothetical protein
MSKQVITYGGEEHLVREDTAKSFRGSYWSLILIALAVLFVAILFFGGFLRSAWNGTIDKTPADVERDAGR